MSSHFVRARIAHEMDPGARQPGRNPRLTCTFGVEVKGLEPSASTLRKCGSRCFDLGLSYDLPGSGISIPSGSLTIPRLPAR